MTPSLSSFPPILPTSSCSFSASIPKPLQYIFAYDDPPNTSPVVKRHYVGVIWLRVVVGPEKLLLRFVLRTVKRHVRSVIHGYETVSFPWTIRMRPFVFQEMEDTSAVKALEQCMVSLLKWDHECSRFLSLDHGCYQEFEKFLQMFFGRDIGVFVTSK